jgi:hypothetical protein
MEVQISCWPAIATKRLISPSPRTQLHHYWMTASPSRAFKVRLADARVHDER